MAQEDYFLKIDGVKGESQDEKHKDEIHCHSFSHFSSCSFSLVEPILSRTITFR